MDNTTPGYSNPFPDTDFTLKTARGREIRFSPWDKAAAISKERISRTLAINRMKSRGDSLTEAQREEKVRSIKLDMQALIAEGNFFVTHPADTVREADYLDFAIRGWPGDSRKIFNKELGTDKPTPEQIKEFYRRHHRPFDTRIVETLEDVFGLPEDFPPSLMPIYNEASVNLGRSEGFVRDETFMEASQDQVQAEFERRRNK